ncbi:MAG: (Na+)-NQR maturation NqrM [Pseudomonadales bacterium]|nr:(Na+)-NQR maturation NqrM [Pseudomonadales bacterium]
MATLFFTIIVVFILVLLMSIGVIMGREPIKGSCGGINALEQGSCSLCGGDPNKCEETEQRQYLPASMSTSQTYDATKH